MIRKMILSSEAIKNTLYKYVCTDMFFYSAVFLKLYTEKKIIKNSGFNKIFSPTLSNKFLIILKFLITKFLLSLHIISISYKN